MFAQFGDIIFELLPSVGGYSEKEAFRYAEHEVVSGKPRSQAVGESLLEISLQLRFDAAFCEPEEEIEKLRGLKKQGSPQDFVLGSGIYKGRFVITDLSTTITRMHDSTLRSADLAVSLKEFGVSGVTVVKKSKRSVAKKKKSQESSTTQSLPARSELYLGVVE
ncbi:hypothetical protein Ctha_0265 [Chloroherpeton thalassium ATCC 35110]|uniref:Uncharacterized protein n=1 Tax=Chloroherpeton thalassium (strain ATCC 35110 / GB-78) TaxID=517418 RepID=B3QTJ0_CHLT3|nr:phage tail protein [Chloroherpeton thalassium]ACF12736.1 hypothetical protein Ctha_0265 [Chloroherpeton thalassium ATCC 35110]